MIVPIDYFTSLWYYTSMSPKNQHPDNNSLVNRLRETTAIASHEIATGTPKDWFLLGAVATGFALDWGPGSEWLVGTVGTVAHESFNPSGVNEVISTGLLSGISAGAASTITQAGFGLLVAGAVRTFPEAFKHWDKTRKHSDQEISPDNKISPLTAIAFGTPGVVIEKNAQNPDRTFKDDAKVVTKTALALGAANTALVTVGSVGVRALENNGHEWGGHVVEQMVKNPALYIATFGLIKAGQYGKARLSKHKSEKVNPIIAATPPVN